MRKILLIGLIVLLPFVVADRDNHDKYNDYYRHDYYERRSPDHRYDYRYTDYHRISYVHHPYINKRYRYYDYGDLLDRDVRNSIHQTVFDTYGVYPEKIERKKYRRKVRWEVTLQDGREVDLHYYDLR